MKKRKRIIEIATVLVVVVVSACLKLNESTIGLSTGESVIENAYKNRQSDVQVETSGMVEKILPDDNEGSRHQKFIVRLASDHTVLIAHNIDLAPRVAGIREGDTVRFAGEYEWTERGGVVHWTHHDPRGKHPGGWIEHAGRVYE
ncbi:MAG: DUF3465 domain-containing protein [Verrucomicrobiota bacterium]